MKIVFPEYDNPIIQEALVGATEIKALPAESLQEACELLAGGSADVMIAGLDHSTRDVILAARDFVGLSGETFSASMYLVREQTAGDAPDEVLVADCAACKHPTEDQLYDICVQTAATAAKLFREPRLALLSFSTRDSARDDTIEMTKVVVARLRADFPEILVDGEMQLDCAVNPRVAAKKAPDSPVAGGANVLVCPDLNSGNILYKSLEQFGGFRAAGPLLQGFKKPISDLSRGSTAEDVKLVIETMRRLYD